MIYPTSVAAFYKFKLSKSKHLTDAEINGKSLVFSKSLNVLNSDVHKVLNQIVIIIKNLIFKA